MTPEISQSTEVLRLALATIERLSKPGMFSSTQGSRDVIAAEIARMEKAAPPITQLEFKDLDFEIAESIAKRLGYEQTAYTSTSGLWGLFCLKENPATWKGNPRAITAGCIIKTREFGFLFVSCLEDLNIEKSVVGL